MASAGGFSHRNALELIEITLVNGPFDKAAGEALKPQDEASGVGLCPPLLCTVCGWDEGMLHIDSRVYCTNSPS